MIEIKTRIEIKTKELKQALLLLTPLTRGANISALKNIRIHKGKSGRFEIFATDLNTYQRIFFEPTNECADGDYNVNLVKLKAAIAKCKADVVSFFDHEGKVAVDVGRIVRYFDTVQAEDLPVVPEIFDKKTGWKKLSYKNEEALPALCKVAETMAENDPRVFLSGVFFHNPEDTDRIANPGSVEKMSHLTRLVSTDGHRLNLTHLCPTSRNGAINPIIIERTAILQMVAALKKNKKAELKISTLLGKKENKHTDPSTYATIHIGEKKQDPLISIYTVGLKSVYSDYTMVVPETRSNYAFVDKLEFAGVIEDISQLTAKRGHGIVLEFSVKGITASVDDPFEGKAECEIKCSELNHIEDNVRFGFNARYLLSCCKVNQYDQLIIEYTDALSPIKIVDPVGDSLFIVMPTKIK